MPEDDRKSQGLKTVVGITPIAPPLKPEKSPFVLVIAGEHSGMMLRVPSLGRLVIGRDPAADLTLNDSQCSRRHAQIYRDANGVIVVEDLGSTNRTVVNGEPLDAPRPLDDGDRIYVGTATILKYSLQDEIEESFQSNLYRSATRDPLTGVYNKRYFLEALDRALRHHQRVPAPLSLMLFDLDHFKGVNDTYGHLAGDEVLKAVARSLSGALRAEAILSRYGGEEFAVILTATSLDEAAQVAERLRALVERTPVPFDGVSLGITASFGLAQAGPEQTSESLFAAADAALYQAKREGRNRVCRSGGVPAG